MTVNVRLSYEDHTPYPVKTMLQEAQEHPRLFDLSMTERPSEGNEYTARLTPKRYGDYNTFIVEIVNEEFSVSLNHNSVHSLLTELNASGVGVGHSVGFWKSLGVNIEVTDKVIEKAVELVNRGYMHKGSIALLKNAKYEQNF